MKRLTAVLLAVATLAACTKSPVYLDESFQVVDEPENVPVVKDPISIQSPTPQTLLTKVALSSMQQEYVKSGNSLAMSAFQKLYTQSQKSFVYSPLSLQFALAMAVNGASGETAREITGTLGFGDDVQALNEYCNILLNQLPALDQNVELKLTDALVVDRNYPLQDGFTKTMNGTYYAPVEYMSFSSLKTVADRINEWAYRSTNGLIFPLLYESDLEGVVAAIMNALYFKAPWEPLMNGCMFAPEWTMKDSDFYLDGGGKTTADLMPCTSYFPYAVRNGYRVVALPYSGGKYAMYVLLPDESGKNGLRDMMQRLGRENWEEIVSSLKTDTEVHLRLPKFETTCSFQLVPVLQALGIRKAFQGDASFDKMFAGSPDGFYIGNILQKARIKVTEWGTEAAAVTVVLMAGANLNPEKKEADFFVDHPFAYVIAERTSGTILFEGIYTGE